MTSTMSVDLNQNSVRENMKISKSDKPEKMPDSSPDFQPKDDVENQEPQENGATNGEDFPDLSLIRKKMSMEEVTFDIENGLRWIRKELSAMREQDKLLTKQLIGMRSKVIEISNLVEGGEIQEDEKEG